MSKKQKILLIISFGFLLFGSLWFLTADINGVSASFDPNYSASLARKVRDIVRILRTCIYIVLLIISFVGIMKNKKQHLIGVITFSFIAFYTIYWIPEFFEYIASLFYDSNYVMTYFFAFLFTFIGDVLLIRYYYYENKQNTK